MEVNKAYRFPVSNYGSPFSEFCTAVEVMKLKDKVAIITGGGRGLGRSVALAFGREGAKVALAARTKEQIEHVAQELRSIGKSVIAIPTDVSDEDQVNHLVNKTLEAYGTIDILVNNAGVRGPIGPIHKISLKDWEQTLRINLTATFLCSKAVLPVMLEKKEGKIINIATTMTPRPNLTPYMVAKAGVSHFTKQLSREVKEFNIQVNAIHPGVMDTKMQKELRKAGTEVVGTDMFERMKAEGILHSPDEPAQLVLFLATKAADGITGEFLSFDDKDVKYLITQG
jgi:NAD(P)-dependent dehydrogenase (short-subunit alcohol dehydrogenase family)